MSALTDTKKPPVDSKEFEIEFVVDGDYDTIEQAIIDTENADFLLSAREGVISLSTTRKATDLDTALEAASRSLCSFLDPSKVKTIVLEPSPFFRRT